MAAGNFIGRVGGLRAVAMGVGWACPYMPARGTAFAGFTDIRLGIGVWSIASGVRRERYRTVHVCHSAKQRGSAPKTASSVNAVARV